VLQSIFLQTGGQASDVGSAGAGVAVGAVSDFQNNSLIAESNRRSQDHLANRKLEQVSQRLA
jgi:hypothetical protein